MDASHDPDARPTAARAPAARCRASIRTRPTAPETGVILTMVKPEWGAKRTCPNRRKKIANIFELAVHAKACKYCSNQRGCEEYSELYAAHTHLARARHGAL